MNDLLPTTVVGSYPQPDWLIDRDNLRSRLPPRVRAREIWRVAEPFLDQAQDDATLIAIRDMEQAGVDIISDGEMRRESYSNRFSNALDGVSLDPPGTAIDRTGHPNPVPRIMGEIKRREPVEVRDLEFLRANTNRRVKMTVPGPFAAGADVIQLDEPYLQARPEKARAYGVEAINRALEGIEGTTAVHLCFG